MSSRERLHFNEEVHKPKFVERRKKERMPTLEKMLKIIEQLRAVRDEKV